MTHNDYQEQVSQLIDGELAAADQPSLFAHLSECAECRNFLNSTLALRSQLAVTAAVPISQEFNQRMQEAVFNTEPLLNRQPAAFRLALAASIAFILLMGSLVFGPQMLWTQPMGAPSGMVSNSPGAPQFPLPQQN